MGQDQVSVDNTPAEHSIFQAQAQSQGPLK